MTKIIAFCGKKGAGKTTAANYLAGIHLSAAGVIADFFGHPDSTIRDGNGNKIVCNNINQNVVKIYSFADLLKQCVIDVFGLDSKLVYGNLKDKDELTHLKWENMPGVVTNARLFNAITKLAKRKKELLSEMRDCDTSSIIHHEAGNMSVREVLQFFGTNICRRMYSQCWTNSLLSQIQKDKPTLAIIDDCRLDHEAECVKENNGYCILLNRNLQQNDEHSTENGFQNFNTWDTVIDNQNTNYREFYALLVISLSPTHINIKIK